MSSSTTRRSGGGGGWVIGLLVLGVGLTAVYAGFRFWQSHQKHEAAVAYCGAIAVEQWRHEFADSMREFDRVVDVAGKSARIALPPMLLRISDTIASAEKKPAPPCMAEGARQTIEGMKLVYETFGDFAAQRGDVPVEEGFERARAQIERGAGLIAKTAETAIH